MFRENNKHLQQSIMASDQFMNLKIRNRLMKSWAPVFYEVVFKAINESIFSELYCLDNGRPNFPVNILLSIEYIKYLFDYNDIELIDQFYYNYQISYALGIKNVGEINLSPGTLYEFRRKIYKHVAENPKTGDLIFTQFIELTKEFVKKSETFVNEQRMDSTMVPANIKNAGRLALAYDVIEQALKAIPEELMTQPMKEFLKNEYKKNLLYKSKGNQIVSRLQELLDLCESIMLKIEHLQDITDLPVMKLLKRFIDEQTILDSDTGKRTIKPNKQIKADSIQSAYDQDATYRKKATKSVKGYTVNIAETCNKENEVQFITDYDVRPNVVTDNTFAEDRLPEIKSNFDVQDIYIDGGYHGDKVKETAEMENIKLHFTDMTGKKVDDEKISVNMFVLNEDKTVKHCPVGFEPEDTSYNLKNDKIIAHFKKETCADCALKDKCCIIEQVKANKFSTTGEVKSLQYLRDEVKIDRKENTSKRAAIEGTISELKRAHSLGDIKVRSKVKVGITTGLKITVCNFKRYARNYFGRLKEQGCTVY